MGDQNKFKAIEEELENFKKKHTNIKESQKNKDINMWEINRMMSSGFF